MTYKETLVLFGFLLGSTSLWSQNYINYSDGGFGVHAGWGFLTGEDGTSHAGEFGLTFGNRFTIGITGAKGPQVKNIGGFASFIWLKESETIPFSLGFSGYLISNRFEYEDDRIGSGAYGVDFYKHYSLSKKYFLIPFASALWQSIEGQTDFTPVGGIHLGTKFIYATIGISYIDLHTYFTAGLTVNLPSY